VIFSYTFKDGAIFVDPSVPIQNFSSLTQFSSATYYGAINFFGRSSNLEVSLPHANGTFKATVQGAGAQVCRSGMSDGRIRFAVNLKGGPDVGAGISGMAGKNCSWR
jgi:hypothetical protein